MKVATRPAPSVPKGATNQRNRFQSSTGKPVGEVKPKKKPPPRPPPPKFNNSILYDKTWDFPSSSNSFNQNVSKKPDFTTSLIDLSIDDDFFKQPAFPIQPVSHFPNESYKFNPNPKPPIAPTKPQVNNFSVGNSSFFGVKANNSNSVNYLDLSAQNLPSGPTIIRVQPRAKKNYGAVKPLTSNQRQYFDSNYSPPMPSIPPPSPPKFLNQAFDDTLPHGVALYQFIPSQKYDLSLEVDDIVIILGKINEEWLYGKVGENEGMFPANFIDVRVSLLHQRNIVTALYQFNPETADDLKLEPGQKINVLKKISQDWLFGESNGLLGQFPANFVDHIPYLL